MPRGKKNKRTNYQVLLTTRLMQISLKMDDHIYCNNLISVTEAEKYLQEISSLKLKYPCTDSRVLQVIEKLTRCMKGIITEDQVDAENVPVSSIQAYTEITDASSPVYSLPDEDRTELFSQDTFINDNVYDQIIDLTEDKEPDNLVEKVKMAISKMGLRNEPQISISDNDFSQSILENIENDNARCIQINRPIDYNLIDVPNNQPGKVINEVNEAAISLPQNIFLEKDCSQNVLDIFYNENTKCSETSQEGELHIYQYLTESNPVTQPTVTNKSNKTITMNNITATQQSKFIDEERNFGLNEEISAKLPAKASKKENKKGRRKKIKENNDTEKLKSQSKVKNTAKTSNKDKRRNRERKTYNIVLGKQVVRSNISVDKPETVIYNKNVECDLSWVENLRYVREISPEENDPTLGILDDNFWNNFSLPHKWNDRDFEI